MAEANQSAFRAEYHTLVVAACEWRAMQADPEVLAGRVFDRLACQNAAPDLHQAFQLVQQVVDETYREDSGRRTIMEAIAGSRGAPLPNEPADSQEAGALRQALAQLGRREREILQLAYWDELARPEIGLVLGLEAVAVETWLERAQARFALLAGRRTGIDATGADSPGLLRSIKPGNRSR
ncbi:MAG: hypothetical protein FWD29_01000 [Micrococcales bacterium]|nr:hypothetical protein [Micrococcales bacterium]